MGWIGKRIHINNVDDAILCCTLRLNFGLDSMT
jgi:hypothetical protein